MCSEDIRPKQFSIAANPPEFFVTIRKSKLEYEFLNDEFCFRIMKILFLGGRGRGVFLFLLLLLLHSSIGGKRHSISACRNQHSRAFSDFMLQCMRCRLQFTSRPCACAPFSSASGGMPPPEPSPIRNYKLCRLAAMVKGLAPSESMRTYDESPKALHRNCQRVEQLVYRTACTMRTSDESPKALHRNCQRVEQLVYRTACTMRTSDESPEARHRNCHSLID